MGDRQPGGERRTTHFYGDGCQPEHKAERSCQQFTAGNHARDLGRVQCVNCGHRYQAHSANHKEAE